MRIDVYVHQEGGQDLKEVLALLHQIKQAEEKIIATLDETLEKVTETRGRVKSLGVLMTDIKKRLDEALASGGGISPEQQAKVDQIFSEVSGAGQDAVDAIDANDDDPNTPPAPTARRK